ncbi:MAG: phosphoribosyltransferase family protein [Planctomycetota bacterium]
MTKFLHVSPEEFLLDTFRLGKAVYLTGFRPKHVISIWRGGTPVGLGVDEFFRTRGLFLNHTTVATESYTGVRQQAEVTVKGLDHVIDVICREDGLLIVDDVLETGRTIQRILEVLRERTRANMPDDIRVATVHRKPERVVFGGLPILTLRDLPGEIWIDYPHELSDLVQPGDDDESNIRDKSEEIWKLLHGEPPQREVVRSEEPYIYLSPRELLLDSFKLGLMVARDNSYRPDFLVALWPGGINSGLPLHEVLKYLSKRTGNVAAPDHISLTTARTRTSYRSDIIGIQYLVDHVEKDHNLLIVDTTFRSGQVVNDVLMKLKEALRRNLTLDRVRVAAVYYNPTDQSTWTVPRAIRRPHYFVKEVDREIVYPQSIHKLARPQLELRERNPELCEVVFGEG